jgi:hypothetical protein
VNGGAPRFNDVKNGAGYDAEGFKGFTDEGNYL